MTDETITRKKVDPSESKQMFTNISVKVHCCRYWMLSEWEFTHMAFPFWRIYHNTLPGASVLYQGQRTELNAEKILVIPPNTAFSNFLKCKDGHVVNERIVGSRIEDIQYVKNETENSVIDHFFIHFNLGLPFDFVKPGIYEVAHSGQFVALLREIKNGCIEIPNNFDLTSSLLINNLITSLLSRLPKNIWQNIEMDKRVMLVIKFIEKNTHDKLSNSLLAEMANMATNSFSRLFRDNTGESLQQYVLKARIEKARNMLHHTNLSIDNIALECGFYDRHHFSKAFKQIMAMSPGYYKLHLTLQ